MASSQTLKKSSEPASLEKEAKEEKKKAAEVIDEIFRSKKSKKRQLEPPSKDEKPEEIPNPKKKSKPKKKKEKSKGLSIVGGEGENRAKRRKTADGLAIYSSEELGFGNPDAGDVGFWSVLQKLLIRSLMDVEDPMFGRGPTRIGIAS